MNFKKTLTFSFFVFSGFASLELQGALTPPDLQSAAQKVTDAEGEVKRLNGIIKEVKATRNLNPGDAGHISAIARLEKLAALDKQLKEANKSLDEAKLSRDTLASVAAGRPARPESFSPGEQEVVLNAIDQLNRMAQTARFGLDPQGRPTSAAMDLVDEMVAGGRLSDNVGPGGFDDRLAKFNAAQLAAQSAAGFSAIGGGPVQRIADASAHLAARAAMQARELGLPDPSQEQSPRAVGGARPRAGGGHGGYQATSWQQMPPMNPVASGPESSTVPVFPAAPGVRSGVSARPLGQPGTSRVVAPPPLPQRGNVPVPLSGTSDGPSPRGSGLALARTARPSRQR